MKRKTLLSLCGSLLAASTLSAQVSVTANQTATIESNGINGTDQMYGQFTGSDYDEYSLAEFSLSSAKFGGQNVLDINSLDLRLTINDRFFSVDGTFSILFTRDSAADLGSGADYDQLTFNSGSSYGIDATQYATAPIVVGSASADTSANGGTTVDVSIDLSSIETDLLDAISNGESVNFLIAGSESADASGVVVTFSGEGNTFDPGDPELIFDVTTDGPVAEPSDHPTGFAASSNLRDINLSWTDAVDATGYLLLISDNNSFTTPTDGIAPIEDLNLEDGSGAIVVAQGTEAATFAGLAENTQYFFSIFPYSNSGTQTDYKTDGTPPTANATTTAVPVGNVIITQYYEGTSSNKYIELSNVTGSPIDMTDFILTSWSNASTEDWKTSGNSTSRRTLFTDIILPAGGTIVVADPNAASPITSGNADVSNGQATFFNGNDSVVLYATSSQDPSNIVDAVSLTNEGFEGGETSFVRLSTANGFDLTAGTSVLDFPNVWSSVDTATVDSASYGDDEFLGSSDLVTPPPQVFFADSSILVTETDVSVNLTIEIQNPDGNAVDVDVIYDNLNSTASLADIENFSTQTVSFGAGAASGDQQTVTITLTNDSESEATENALFNLGNLVTAGTSILGSPSTFSLFVQDDDTTIPNIFISEIVDPSDSAADGRYVELYNPTASPVDLGAGNWNLVIYFNANTSGQDIALTGTIPAGGTYIVAESDNFGTVYTDVSSDQTGNVNSNGDDNFELRFGGGQTGGVLVDVYGQPGTDGSGFAWEFTDSRAYRNSSVVSSNTTWTESEWTIEATDIATGNMTPDVHPETGGPALPTFPITEDFGGTSTWVNQTVSGSFGWQIDSVDERAEADGFDRTAEENHYLVSPAFNFTGSSDVTISFNYGEAFDGPDLELLYSTNYSGTGDPEAAGVVWTPVAFTFSDSSTGEAFSASASGGVLLPAALNGLTGVYIAFKYTADGSETGSEQWFIDDIVIDAIVTATDPLADYLTSRSLTSGDLDQDVNGNGYTIFEEYLAGFGDGSGSDTIEFGIDTDGKLALTLISDRDGEPEGITVSLLATNDLDVAFTPVSFTYSVVGNLDGTYTHIYEETAPPVSDTRFLQLQIQAD